MARAERVAFRLAFRQGDRATAGPIAALRIGVTLRTGAPSRSAPLLRAREACGNALSRLLNRLTLEAVDLVFYFEVVDLTNEHLLHELAQELHGQPAEDALRPRARP